MYKARLNFKYKLYPTEVNFKSQSTQSLTFLSFFLIFIKIKVSHKIKQFLFFVCEMPQ